MSFEPMRIAVLGVGLMGAGIASLLADAGHNVTAWDVRADALAELKAAFPRIATTPDLATAVGSAQVVMEAIAENLAAKHAVYASISAINATCIVASNTSSLSASLLASGLSSPERFAIAHFFNHPRIVPLVEVVPAEHTSEETLETLRAMLDHAGKLPVILRKEVPGFVANRLQAAMYREAFALAEEGVASFEDIDLIVRGALGSRWAAAGPMTVVDAAGLDIWQAVMTQLYPLLSNVTEAPAAIREAVERGELGAKTGKGLYGHTKEQDQALRDRIGEHFNLEFPAVPK